MAPLPGYRKLPGRAERYERLSDGETISRRQYENERFRAGGWTSWSEYQRAAKTESFQRWAFIEKLRTGKTYSQIVNPMSGFSKKFIAAKHSNFTPEAHGAFADLLEYLELRDDDSDYDVGETQIA